MELYGKVVKNGRIVKDAKVENNDYKLDFRDKLEACLLNLCKMLEIPVPLWLTKNTTDFARYRRTSFDSEQFVDEVGFDRLEIKLGY